MLLYICSWPQLETGSSPGCGLRPGLIPVLASQIHGIHLHVTVREGGLAQTQLQCAPVQSLLCSICKDVYNENKDMFLIFTVLLYFLSPNSSSIKQEIQSFVVFLSEAAVSIHW